MLLEPTPQSILRCLDHVNDLKQLPRMGWLLAGVASPESVADHTCAVALLALALAERINADWQAEGLAQPLDVGRVLRVALLHDLAESILTDLPKRSSDLIGKPVKHAAESSAMRLILAGLPQHDEWLALWCEYDAASTPEARLVRDADMLEMIHQATRYMRRGQTNLGEFLRDHAWSYRLCEQLQAVLSENTSSSTLTADFAAAVSAAAKPSTQQSK